jgi:hypothetical protein
MVHIRKARAGNDSFGNEWPEDDAVVEVPAEQAAALMAIPDGGFSEAPAPKKTQKQEEPRKDDGDQNDGAAGEGAEQKTDVDEAPKPARRGRPPKTKTVEE